MNSSPHEVPLRWTPLLALAVIFIFVLLVVVLNGAIRDSCCAIAIGNGPSSRSTAEPLVSCFGCQFVTTGKHCSGDDSRDGSESSSRGTFSMLSVFGLCLSATIASRSVMNCLSVISDRRKFDLPKLIEFVLLCSVLLQVPSVHT